MKSSTDIEQSKKLAEILLLESADMYMYYDRYGDPYFINVSVTHERIKNDKYQHLIPCWSLTALLSVLPRVDIEKGNVWALNKVIKQNDKPIVLVVVNSDVHNAILKVEQKYDIHIERLTKNNANKIFNKWGINIYCI